MFEQVPNQRKRTFQRMLVLLAATLVLLPACSIGETYQEPFRPQFHFTPERNWMNDPNGMVFADGVFHLFYQYNPQGDKWGHMSWGHATSRDLVRWEHQPLALPEKGDIMAFSGSAVVDSNNTAGFGSGALVAIYTGHNEKAKRQDQRLAYSTDGGRTWQEYQGNPVLDIQAADFRDPKVFWHAGSKAWIMVVAMATEKKVRFYSSPDLKKWVQLSEFGPAGAIGGLWECPDLFRLPVDGGTEKWVLLVNINPGGPAGGSGCQYFIGEFDGRTFKLDTAPAPSTPAPASESADIVLGDFETGYGDWTASGEAFEGTEPSFPAGDSPVSGFEGNKLVDSFGGRDEAVGTLTSPEFTIEGNEISFLIGGGNQPNEMGLNLVVDGEVVRTETGNNSPTLEGKVWDVSDLRGKKAHLEIFDRSSNSDWGHILVDHIVMGGASSAPSSSAASLGDRGILWADYGPDFYAAVTWSDIPAADGRRILIGWMSNWDYADKTPTAPWRGAMSVPRTLRLLSTPKGIRLAQEPVASLSDLQDGPPQVFNGGSFSEASDWLSQHQELPALLDVKLTFTEVRGATPFQIALHTGPGESTIIEVNAGTGKITVDRSRSGAVGFHPRFGGRSAAPLQIEDGKVNVRFLLDTSSLEVFAQDGVSVLSNLIFPATGPRSLSLSAEGSSTPSVDRIEIQPLKSGWTPAP